MSAPLDADSRAVASMAGELAKMQRRIELLEMGANTSQLGQSSIEDGSLVVYDADGNPRSVIGKQADGSYVGGTSPFPAAPPEVPRTPTVTAGFGTLKIATNGSTDPPWPSDFSHVNVYLAEGVEGGPDPVGPGVVVGTVIGMTNSMLVVANLDAKPYRVWLSSVNISGSESDYSTAVIASPTKVVSDDILDGAITTLQLAADAVTAANIAAGAVGTIQIGDEVIDVTKLADGSVDGDKIVASAIAAGHLGAGSVTAVALAAQAVQAANIAVGAVQAGSIAAGAVTTDKLLALGITADKLAANSVTAGAIAAGAITADKLRAGEVLADVSLATGSSGRRILISGAANEIRFFPQLGETAYGRLFSYVSLQYPDDVNIEMRAIDSAETVVQPRLYLTPDRAFVGLTSAADETVTNGGQIDLQQGGAFFGHKGPTGKTAGLEVYDEGNLRFRGYFENYVAPHTDDAIFTLTTSVTNTSGTNYISGLAFDYGVTMDTFVAPMITCGQKLSGTRDYNVREEGGDLTGFDIRIGSFTATAVLPGETIAIRAWGFRVLAEFPQNVVGTS